MANRIKLPSKEEIIDKLQKDRESRLKKVVSPDSTSLSASVNDRKHSNNRITVENDAYGLGIRGFFMKLCTRMCMDIEVAEEE